MSYGAPAAPPGPGAIPPAAGPPAGQGPSADAAGVPPHDDAAKEEAERRTERRAYITDVAAAVLLGVATTLSALAAHQGDIWGGQSLLTYNDGMVKMNEATSAMLLGAQVMTVDTMFYSQWVTEGALGEAQNDPTRMAVAKYIETKLMGEDFRIALQWAQSSGHTPFEFPGYALGSAEQQAVAKEVPAYKDAAIPGYALGRLGAAANLVKKGEEIFAQGQEQDATGDAFMFTTLFHTASMFFAGIAATLRRMSIKITFISCATVAMLYATVKMFLLPFMF